MAAERRIGHVLLGPGKETRGNCSARLGGDIEVRNPMAKSLLTQICAKYRIDWSSLG